MRQKAVNKNVKYSYDKKNTTEYSFGSKFQNFCHKNCCIAQGVGKNYVHVCFVVVYQDSKTSPDAIVDYVFNDSIFLLRAGSTRFFITFLPIHQSNESNARIFEHRSPTAFPLSLFLFFGQRMHSRLCN